MDVLEVSLIITRRPGSSVPRWVPLVSLWLLLGRAAAVPASATSPPRDPLEALVRGLFVDPERILTLVPMPLPPEDDARTRWALRRLFSTATVESLEIGDHRDPRRPGPIRVVLRHVDLMGLDIERMAFTVTGIVLEAARMSAGQLVAVAPFAVACESEVREDALNRVSRDHRVRLTPDTFSLSGKNQVLFLNNRYVLDAEVAIQDNQLWVRPRRLKYGILPIPRPVVKALMDGVNPLFDMDRFLGTVKQWAPLTLKQPRIGPGNVLVRVEGEIRPQVPEGGTPGWPTRAPVQVPVAGP